VVLLSQLNPIEAFKTNLTVSGLQVCVHEFMQLESGTKLRVEMRTKGPGDLIVVLLTPASFTTLMDKDAELSNNGSRVMNRTVVDSLRRFPSFWRASLREYLNVTIPIVRPDGETWSYLLCVISPTLETQEFTVAMNMERPNGSDMGVENDFVVETFCVLAGVYFVAIIAFHVMCRFHLTAASANFIHLMMYVALVLRVLFYVSGGLNEMNSSLSVRSPYKDVFGIAQGLLRELRDVWDLNIFFCIAAGWKFMKRKLRGREVRIAAAVSYAMVYLTHCKLHADRSALYRKFETLHEVLTNLTLYVVIIAATISLSRLHDKLNNLPMTQRCAKLYNIQRAYQLFRILIFIRFFDPMLANYVRNAHLARHSVWAEMLLLSTPHFIMDFLLFFAIAPMLQQRPLKVFAMLRDEYWANTR